MISYLMAITMLALSLTICEILSKNVLVDFQCAKKTNTMQLDSKPDIVIEASGDP